MKAKVAGEWKNSLRFVKISGTWQPVKNVYVKVDGVWVQIHNPMSDWYTYYYGVDESGYATTPVW